MANSEDDDDDDDDDIDQEDISDELSKDWKESDSVIINHGKQKKFGRIL